MADLAYQLGIYLHLARASERRMRPLVRDRLLVLAGVTAAEMNLPAVAAYCRQKVLSHNPGHMLRRWPTIEQALKDDRFTHLTRQLLRRYPAEKAERMLNNLGIIMGRERESYYSDLEYAAALLGMSTESLRQQYGDSS